MTSIDLLKTHKRFYAALGALELAGRGLDHRTRLMVQLHASFLNDCRYCIDLHSREVLKKGPGQEFIDAVRAGRDHPAWDDRDRLVLDFTTMGTLLADGFDEDLHERVLAEFGPKTTGDLIAAIATINTWNRIGKLTRK